MDTRLSRERNGIETRRNRHFSFLRLDSSVVEQSAVNRKVEGSFPSPSATYGGISVKGRKSGTMVCGTISKISNILYHPIFLATSASGLSQRPLAPLFPRFES